MASFPLNQYIFMTASSRDTSWAACHLHVCLLTLSPDFFSPCCHPPRSFLASHPFREPPLSFWQVAQKGLCAPVMCREAFSRPVPECFVGIINCEKHHSWGGGGGGEALWNNSFKIFAWIPLHIRTGEYTCFTEPHLFPESWLGVNQQKH